MKKRRGNESQDEWRRAFGPTSGENRCQHDKLSKKRGTREKEGISRRDELSKGDSIKQARLEDVDDPVCETRIR